MLPYAGLDTDVLSPRTRFKGAQERCVPAPDDASPLILKRFFTLCLLTMWTLLALAENPREPQQPYDFSLRTNLLYDALAVPNVGVELYLPKGWAVGGSFDYAWWTKHSKHRSWRFIDLEADVRHWLGGREGMRPYTGHHVGAYGQWFTYDFAWGRKGYLGGVPKGKFLEKCNYSYGVEYGYTFPLSARLNLDLNVGLGYAGGTYYEYRTTEPCDVWQQTSKRSWWGPTKAEVSLAWLFHSGFHSKKKGGV